MFSNTVYIKSLHWLKINEHEHIEYKLLSLTYKALTIAQPTLHSLISVQHPHGTRSLLICRHPLSTTYIFCNRSFRCAPHLWNQLPDSFRQLCMNHSSKDVTYTKPMLGRSLFLLKNRFLDLVLPNLNRSADLHTPIVVRNTHCGPTYTAIGVWAAPGQTRTAMFFSVFVTHPKSYIETTDRRDFGGKPSMWRRGRVLSWKFRNFVARSKNNIISHFRVPFDYPAHSLQETVCPKPMVPMESRGSEGVPFASLHGESVTRHLADIGPWRMPKSGHMTITKIEKCI